MYMYLILMKPLHLTLQKLGIPMQAKGRVQINIQMARIAEIPQAAKLANVLIPVIWFEDVSPLIVVFMQIRMVPKI